MLHLVRYQAYKLKLPKKWKIHNVFHVLLLEQDTIKNKQVEENVTQLELKADDNAKYKIETIWNYAIYAKKLKAGHLLKLYYLILWKGYLKKENI